MPVVRKNCAGTEAFGFTISSLPRLQSGLRTKTFTEALDPTPNSASESDQPESRLPHGPRKSRQEQRAQLAFTIKILMVAGTFLWPVCIVLPVIFNLVAAERGQNIGAGMYMTNDGYIGDQDDREAMIIVTSLTGGLCCPTVPYAIAMTVLGVIYFAVRPEPGANLRRQDH